MPGLADFAYEGTEVAIFGTDESTWLVGPVPSPLFDTSGSSGTVKKKRRPPHVWGDGLEYYRAKYLEQERPDAVPVEREEAERLEAEQEETLEDIAALEAAQADMVRLRERGQFVADVLWEEIARLIEAAYLMWRHQEHLRIAMAAMLVYYL